MRTLTYNVYRIKELPTPQAMSYAEGYVREELKADIITFKLVKEKVRLLLESFGLFIVSQNRYNYIDYREADYYTEGDVYQVSGFSISVNKYLLCTNNINHTQREYPKSVQYVTGLKSVIEYKSDVCSIQCQALEEPTYTELTAFNKQEYWRLSGEIAQTIEKADVQVDKLIKQILKEKSTAEQLYKYSTEQGYEFLEDGSHYSVHKYHIIEKYNKQKLNIIKN